ncbi:phosphotriesterase [Streptomyces sp. NPDC088350]|uniref:phosphotriesterase family protein n=1 Tax=Streptomyces sp. NPDC088350 TaxID=3365854 RepID=UPI0037FBA422
MTSTVSTARGPVACQELGTVLPHEHLFINLMRERRGDGLIADEAAVTEELSVFTGLGGATVVDLTSAELTPGAAPDTGAAPPPSDASRDPANVLAVQRVAEATGLHVVLGTGHYRDPFLDRDWFDRHGADAIAEEIVRDLTEGFPGTGGIRAGIIGEVGCDKWYISAAEERSLRAAARAQRATGAGIHTHAARWPVGVAQLDLLASEGADPARIAVGHCDTVTAPGYAEQIARRGAYVGVDTINTDHPREVDHRVRMVLDLVRAGYIDNILLSHDVCLLSQLRAHGGGGYGFVHTGFRERLLAAGLDAGEFAHITTANPARLLCS